jgi:hypothetical protein
MEFMFCIVLSFKTINTLPFSVSRGKKAVKTLTVLHFRISRACEFPLEEQQREITKTAYGVRLWP